MFHKPVRPMTRLGAIAARLPREKTAKDIACEAAIQAAEAAIRARFARIDIVSIETKAAALGL